MAEIASQQGAERLPEGEVLRINEWEAAGRFFLGGFLVLVGLGYALAKHGHSHHVPWWLVPLLGVVCIGLGVAIAASSRAGLKITPAGITVQRAFSRSDLSWAELRSFELTDAIYGTSLRIDLTDGRHIGTRGFKTRSRDQRALAEQWVAELNRRLRDAVSGR
jgi:hypothetical protein